MASNILSYAGWYFLPNLVTNYAQTALYAIFIRAGDPKPAPGTQRYVRDRKRIAIGVILLYLLYTIYEADYQLLRASDFYRDLGVPLDVEERALQSRFRRLTVQFHPDKVSGADKSFVEAVYIQLKLARDTLADPAKRFAYDRLGPDVLQWKSCKTARDFIFTGAQHATVYYVVSGAVLVLLGFLGYLESGKYWRYLVMGSLFMVELHALTRPQFPAVLTRLVNPILVTTGLRAPYLPFQMVALLRKLSITFFIALSQLGPLLRDTQKPGKGSGDGIDPQQLDRLDALVKAQDTEVGRLMGLELMPFAADQNATKDLRKALSEWLVQNTVRNDPEVTGAVERVLNARRQMVADSQGGATEQIAE